MTRILTIAAIALGTMLSPPLAADGADAARALTKEELLHQLATRESHLELEQARADMETARVEHEEMKGLFEKKIVTIDDLNKAKQAYGNAVLRFEGAEIQLEKTKLEFLKDNTFIAVTEAKKYRTEEGDYKVSVSFRNGSDLRKSRTSMGDTTLTDVELASLLNIDNIIVSLYGTANRSVAALVGDPYQQIIPVLQHNDTVTLDFDLLDRTLDEVTIVLEYLGDRREYTVKLKKDAARDLPTIASTQYAQEGQLGSKIRYDLELERLASTEQSFSLVVLNLPRAVSFAFLDPGSSARLTHLKFTEERSSQHIQLEISIPEKLDEKHVDANIDFTVVVTRPAELAEIGEIRQKHGEDMIPAEEIVRIRGSKVGLKLIPIGVGKLDILVANLFKEVKRGDPIGFKFTLLNSGTLALRAVTPELSLPLEWEGTTEPKTRKVIDPGEKVVFAVSLTPPADIAIGEYSIKLGADGRAGIETVEATEKDFTVRLAAESNVTGTLVLVGVLVLLVLGIAIASVRISRR